MAGTGRVGGLDARAVEGGISDVGWRQEPSCESGRRDAPSDAEATRTAAAEAARGVARADAARADADARATAAEAERDAARADADARAAAAEAACDAARRRRRPHARPTPRSRATPQFVEAVRLDADERVEREARDDEVEERLRGEDLSPLRLVDLRASGERRAREQAREFSAASPIARRTDGSRGAALERLH